MHLTENLIGLIIRLDCRDMGAENDILRENTGIELDKALIFYLFKSWHLALQKRRVSLAVPQMAYTEQDWEDWKIIENLKEEEIK